MELVYLWVENYKNIHHQGFNFSPRFHCEYNEEDNELTINENDDYIPDFFGKNINVTAIVGKNGSGKSRILELIQLIVYNKYSTRNFILIKKNEEFYCSSSININLKVKSSFKYFIDFRKHFRSRLETIVKSPLFDYSLSYNYSALEYSDIYMRYPNKKEGILNFKDEEYQNQKNIINNYLDLKEKNQLNKFKDFFQPYKISITLNHFKLEKPIDGSFIPKEEIDKLKKEINQEQGFKVLEKFNNFFNVLCTYYDKEAQKLVDDMDNEYKIKAPKLSVKLNIKIEDFTSDEDAQILDINKANKLERFEYVLDSLEERKIKNISKLKKIFEKNLISTSMDNKFCEFLIDELEIGEVEELIKIVDNKYFFINLVDVNTKELSKLSFGEQQLIKILNRLYIFKKDNSKDYLILLDEIDMGFHPNWQKKIIQYIIDFLSLIPDKNFHIIFTTHSPFLLSDIPKKNIIFLNDKPSINQTFGANIHTLLSDSFFMEDGLMGEFAKKKIKEIMDFLNNIKTIEEISTKEEQIKQVIESIGEPFLKDKLLRMYYDKFDTKKQERIKELKAELKRLENG